MSYLQDVQSPEYKKARKLHLKTTKNRPNVDADWSPFRIAEKKYKARFPPPDLTRVLDVAVGDRKRDEEVHQGGWHGTPDAIPHRRLPLAAGVDGHAIVFPGIPGLVLLPSFLSPQEQRSVIQWSLMDHARYPNETNLDTHYFVPEEGIWDVYCRSLQDGTPPEEIPPRASSSSPPLIPGAAGPRQLISNEPADKSNYQALATIPKPPATPSATVKPATAIDLITRLRWANIGWHYHWGTKHYDLSRGKIDVSDLYRSVCKRAVCSVPWREAFVDDSGDWGTEESGWETWGEAYEPDAGIVNFYQTKDTLMGHVDRSEVCATSPLVSISLGCAAIFLIGGLTRDVEPVPILLRSGDVVIMSGPHCRRAYHGVPRILENTLPPHLASTSGDACTDWYLYEEYMRAARINVNVRQVFPKGFDPGRTINQTN